MQAGRASSRHDYRHNSLILLGSGFWADVGGISIAAVTAAMGSAFTASPFKVFDKIPQNASQGNEIDVGRSSSAV
jgi:hypothetical protein